jgi:hypothetical protein
MNKKGKAKQVMIIFMTFNLATRLCLRIKFKPAIINKAIQNTVVTG